MGLEIERKFLLADRGILAGRPYKTIRQGYLNVHPERTVRVRVTDAKAFLTIKGQAMGLTRQEFEYEIPWEDGEQLLKLCERFLVEKQRFEVEFGGHVWEVDIFSGRNEGLAVAEIELASEDEKVDMPSWIGQEVSDDQRYKNANLAVTPFKDW